jgi:hypothetical protein
LRWSIVAGLLAFFAVAATDAQAADRFSVGDWDGQARFDSTGKFSRCTLEGRYRSGIVVDFGLTRAYEVEIWLANPAWRNLRKDREYDVEYWIDGYPHQYGTFVSMGGGFGRIDVGNASRIFDQLRAGVRLSVAGIRDTEVFRLDDTYVGLGRLLQCVTAALDAEHHRTGSDNRQADRDFGPDDDRRPHGDRPDSASGNSRNGWQAGPLFDDRQPSRTDRDDDRRQAPPPGIGNGRNDNRPDDRGIPDDGPDTDNGYSVDNRGHGGNRNRNGERRDTGDRQDSAADFMGLVFKARDFAAFHILHDKDVPGPLRTEDVVWAGPDVLGFASRLVGKSPTDAILERIKHDQDSCKDGDFDTAGKPVTLANGATVYRYTTVCYDTQSFFARYSAYPARDGSWYLIGSMGVQRPDEADHADEAIFRIIAQALRG